MDFNPDVMYCDDCGIELTNHSLWEFSMHTLCYTCYKDRNGED